MKPLYRYMHNPLEDLRSPEERESVIEAAKLSLGVGLDLGNPCLYRVHKCVHRIKWVSSRFNEEFRTFEKRTKSEGAEGWVFDSYDELMVYRMHQHMLEEERYWVLALMWLLQSLKS